MNSSVFLCCAKEDEHGQQNPDKIDDTPVTIREHYLADSHSLCLRVMQSEVWTIGLSFMP